MLIDPFANHPLRRRAWLEGIGLLIAAPFLIFPTQFVGGTLLALLLILVSWLWPWQQQGRVWLPQTPLNGALLCLTICLSVAILVTADPDLTLPKATNLILGLACWRFLAWIGSGKRVVWGSLSVYVALGLAFTLVGSLSTNWFIKIPALARFLPPRLLTLPGSGAAGVQANQLAGTILFYWPLLVSLLIGWTQQRWIPGRGADESRNVLPPGAGAALRAGVGVLTALVSGLLVLTQSRSGWVGGCAGLLLLVGAWAWLLPPSRVRLLLRLLLGACLLAGVIGILMVGPDQIADIWEDPVRDTAFGNLGTLDFRKEVWRWGVAAVGDFPLTGTGLGTFRRVLQRLYPTQIAPPYDVAHAHNIFLQVALDIGLPGLVSYLALLLLCGWMGWRVARLAAPRRAAAVGLLSGIAALHIFGLTDALALGSKPALLFWMALGILTGMFDSAGNR